MWKRIFHWDHLMVTLLTFVVMAVFVFISMNVSFFNPVARAINSFSMTDVYYASEQELAVPDTSRMVTIVDISELYDRSGFAEMTNILHSLQPAVIGYDVVFEGLRGDTLGSMLLAEAIDNASGHAASEKVPMVFAFKLKFDEDSLRFTSSTHSFFSRDISLIEGYVNVQSDIYGNTIQKFSVCRDLEGNTVYSFPWQVVKACEPDLFTVPDGNQDDLFIDWTPTVFSVVSYDSLWENKDLITGRIVLVGAMNEDMDKHWTPLGRLSGVEMYAYSIQTLHEHKNIHYLEGWGVFLLSFLVVYLTQVTLYGLLTYATRETTQSWLSVALNTSIFQSFVLFIWAGLLIWFGFIVYVKCDLYVNQAWMLMGIAMVSISREFYITTLKTFGKHHNWALIRRSLYVSQIK